MNKIVKLKNNNKNKKINFIVRTKNRRRRLNYMNKIKTALYNFSSRPQTNGKGLLKIVISNSINTTLNNALLTYELENLIHD